jgi:hypothetical protein
MNSKNNEGSANGGKMIHAGTGLQPAEHRVAGPVNADVQDPEQPIVREGSPQPLFHSPVPAHPHPLNDEMRTRWASFVDADLKDVRTREDLSAAIVAKYGITAEVAATQVKDWAVGRQF